MDELKRRLSVRQQILIEEFIQRNDFSVIALDKMITTMKLDLEQAKKHLELMKSNLGIKNIYWNRFNRNPIGSRTELQKTVLTYVPDVLYSTDFNFIDSLEELCKKIESDLESMNQIRIVFVDIFPEAKLSPRLSRSELEQSPTRFLSGSRKINKSSF
jgi:hypothetical protein